jgi:anti-anti-sigma factor
LYGIEVRRKADGTLVVELRGEFDLFAAEELKETLSGVAALRRPTVVDLSKVTFLDVQATRELAVRAQLYAHHLTLLDPSWQVRASVRACKLEDWVRFGHSQDRPARRFLEVG